MRIKDSQRDGVLLISGAMVETRGERARWYSMERWFSM